MSYYTHAHTRICRETIPDLQSYLLFCKNIKYNSCYKGIEKEKTNHTITVCKGVSYQIIRIYSIFTSWYLNNVCIRSHGIYIKHFLSYLYSAISYDNGCYQTLLFAFVDSLKTNVYQMMSVTVTSVRPSKPFTVGFSHYFILSDY